MPIIRIREEKRWVVIGDVNPNGNVTPEFIGQLFWNEDLNNLYVAEGLDDDDWELVNEDGVTALVPFRTGEEAQGPKDLSNTIFDSPHNFIPEVGNGGFYFEFFRNGQLQINEKQYRIIRSGSIGIGIEVFRPPYPFEDLRMNYVKV